MGGMGECSSFLPMFTLLMERGLFGTGATEHENGESNSTIVPAESERPHPQDAFCRA